MLRSGQESLAIPNTFFRNGRGNWQFPEHDLRKIGRIRAFQTKTSAPVRFCHDHGANHSSAANSGAIGFPNAIRT
jgi:hypothetical protein